MWIIHSFEPLACRDCRNNLEVDRATDFATAPDEIVAPYIIYKK